MISCRVTKNLITEFVVPIQFDIISKCITSVGSPCNLTRKFYTLHLNSATSQIENLRGFCPDKKEPNYLLRTERRQHFTYLLGKFVILCPFSLNLITGYLRLIMFSFHFQVRSARIILFLKKQNSSHEVSVLFQGRTWFTTCWSCLRWEFKVWSSGAREVIFMTLM